jgi:hypothetical protein
MFQKLDKVQWTFIEFAGIASYIAYYQVRLSMQPTNYMRKAGVSFIEQTLYKISNCSKKYSEQLYTRLKIQVQLLERLEINIFAIIKRLLFKLINSQN